MKNQVFLDIIVRLDTQDVVFNMVFPDTGEIRQKKRSLSWLMKRVYFHELRTWKTRGEIIEYEEEKLSCL